MKAVVFEAPGEPRAVLHLAHAERPALRDGEVLLKVSARPIQPADHAFVRGRYRVRPRLPQIAGLEGAGMVVETTPDAKATIGSKVAFRWPGSWAEYVAVPESRTLRVPRTMPDEIAAQVALNPLTAWGLLDEARAREGQWIVVTAATSTVANIVGRMARKRGVRVIGIARDAGAARERMAADEALAADDGRLVERIRAITGGEGAAALLDSVGGPLLAGLLASLAPGARVVSYGMLEDRPAAVSNATMIYANLTWLGFGIDRWLSQLPDAERERMQHEVLAMVANGEIALPVEATFGLDDFERALREDGRHGRRGKVLLA